MPSIDERVVSMAFENAKFEAGVAVTLTTLTKLNDSIAKIGTVSGLANIEAEANKVTLNTPMAAIDKLKTKLGFGEAPAAFGGLERAGDRVTMSGPARALDKLKAKLGFPEAGKAFGDVEKAADKVTLSGVSSAIESVAGKFSAIEVAAVTAFGTMVSKATSAATEMAKKFSLGPIAEGMDEYGLKLNAVQTIMAATGKGSKPVIAALDELNRYSDKTIYSFKDMIENIPKFTNAGVSLTDSVSAIQGIAQVAAVSGANTNEAARAMYNFGQALGQGHVKLIDWKSIELANMGTVEFKQQLIDTAVAMGTLTKDAEGNIKTKKGNIVTTKNFTQNLKDEWLTAEALTKTLKKYTDEQTALGKKAFASATDIKTLSQLMGVFKEQLASGWAQSFEAIFGNLDEAKKLWKSVNEVIGGFIGRSAEARNKVLKDWAKLGGRKDLIEGIKNVWQALMNIIKPIRDAFRDIFPAKTGKDLAEMSERFKDFTAGLAIGKDTMEGLRRTFRGLFAALHIGWTIVKRVGQVILDLLGVVGKGSGGFLNFTGGIGDFLVALDKAISEGKILEGFFDGLTGVLKLPLTVLKNLASALAGLFGSGDPKKIGQTQEDLEGLGKVLAPLAGVADVVTKAWEKLQDIFVSVGEFVAPMVQSVADAVGTVGTAIGETFNNIDIDKVLSMLQTGLIAGIFVYIKKAFGKGFGIDVGGGMFEKLGDSLDALTGNLKAMQQNLQAGTLLKLAGAIGVMAVAILLMSTIKPEKLTPAMTAMAVGVGQMVTAMALLAKIGGTGAFITLPIMATGLIALATAMLIMGAAMKVFSTLSWEDMGKGLAGVGGSLAAIGAGLKLINPVSIFPAAAAILVMSVAMNLLAVAMIAMSKMKWEEMAKGLVAVGGSLAAIGLAMGLIPPTIMLTAGGVLVLSAAMVILSGAVRSFGSMNLGELAKGILGAAAAIAALGFATAIIPPTIGIQAAGLILLGVGLTALAGAIAIFGNMDVKTLAKGIISIGGALVVLGFALTAMAGTLPGTVALLAAAAALTILVPAVALMGSLDWSTILKGLAGIALSLGTIAIVGLVAAPALLALGGALSLLGTGLLLVATAVYIASKGLALLGDEGQKAVKAIVLAMTAFVLALPPLVINFIKGLVSIIAEIAKVAPRVLEAVGEILTMLFAFVAEQAPKMAVAVGALIQAFITVVVDNAPQLIAAGLNLLVWFLEGIAQNIGRVTAAVGNIVVNFLNTLTLKLPEIIKSGLGMLTAFLKGIADNLPKVIAEASRVVTTFLTEITRRLPNVIAKGAQLVRTFLNSVAEQLPSVIRSGVNLIVKFLNGIAEGIPKIVAAGGRVIRKFITAIADEFPKMIDTGFKAVIKFLNGVAKAIRENDQDLIDAGINIADAIGDGLVEGFKRIAPKVLSAAKDLITSLPKSALKLLDIKSPSGVFKEIGIQTMAGLTVGLKEGGAETRKTMNAATQDVINTAGNTLGKVPDMLAGMTDLDPTITPVLDLSEVEKGARRLGDLTKASPVVATVSAGVASDISAETQRVQSEAAATQAPVMPNVTLEQNNYSPESLSDTEIYRQTKNQLSQLKNVLGVPGPYRVQYSA